MANSFIQQYIQFKLLNKVQLYGKDFILINFHKELRYDNLKLDQI